MSPWRAPGGSLEACGRPLGSKSDFRAILDGFLGVFGALKIEKNRAELRLNIDANFERAFEGLREAPGGRFGVDFGVL